MDVAKTLEVLRDNPAQTRIVEDALPASLTDGQVLLAVDRFALTANNISYSRFGGALGYWRFFPTADEQWGRVPAMGYAAVAASAHSAIEVGERVWGFFPMGTHLTIEAGAVNPFGFSDVSAHREGLAPIYSQFQRAAANPFYLSEREEQDSLLRGLFLTSWLCEDMFFDQDFFAANNCLITSASSKTSIALGFVIKDRATRDRGRMRAIALTSEKNKAFCENLGCYDLVVTYTELASLPADGNAVLVDMAGNGSLNDALHHHFGERLAYDCRIGMTHIDAAPAADTELPGPKPEMFFAPHQAAKRGQEWGAEELEQRIGSSFVRFREFADSWLRIRRFDGPDAATQAFEAVLAGKTDPDEGYTVSLG
ncbi:MAG: DUF2855 family protein [Congregibacter sp.]